MIITGKFPALRLRRNRKFEWTRRLIQESNLSTNDLILPIFLIDGKNKNQSIKSMPGIYRYTIDSLGKVIDRALSQKLPMIALFPYTNSKLKKIFLILIENLKLRNLSILRVLNRELKIPIIY